ncbi:MAG: serine/threonine-protein kinase [Thermoanaerobaculia bacterium]
MTGRKIGSYEVLEKLGEGGMGEVYRASDPKLKREVAIKVLPAAFTNDSERLARFEREAQLLAQLHHPNIASIFGLEESDGERALVMELVEGPTLAERLTAGPLAVAEALPIARQIAEALEEAHEKGIVHRDLKPQNVKVTADGTVKVLDFGLAKAMEEPGSTAAADVARSPTIMNSPTLTAVHGTQLGVILGTAAYMAPEQAAGAAVDRRADIWAFGVVLFEMLTGKSLFAADTVPDTLARVCPRAGRRGAAAGGPDRGPHARPALSHPAAAEPVAFDRRRTDRDRRCAGRAIGRTSRRRGGGAAGDRGQQRIPGPDRMGSRRGRNGRPAREHGREEPGRRGRRLARRDRASGCWFPPVSRPTPPFRRMAAPWRSSPVRRTGSRLDQGSRERIRERSRARPFLAAALFARRDERALPDQEETASTSTGSRSPRGRSAWWRGTDSMPTGRRTASGSFSFAATSRTSAAVETSSRSISRREPNHASIPTLPGRCSSRTGLPTTAGSRCSASAREVESTIGS